MKYYLLPLLAFSLIATRQFSNAAKDESVSKEDETSSESTPASDQIRQCTCTELAECSEKSREKFRSCADKCVDKLADDDWDEEAGRKCFAHKQQSNKKHCFEELKNQTCAAEDGVMINKNETFRGLHNRHHKKGNGSHEEGDHPADSHHHQRGGKHHRNGLFNFVKKNFGESGKEYIKCVKQCIKKNKKGQCPRSLKCGVKRLEAEQMKEGMAKCQDEKAAHRHELCECLQKAGMKDIECVESNTVTNKIN